MSFNRKKLKCGAHYNSMQTFKYKKNYICISFIIPHNLENAAHSSLLMDVLTRATELHPTLRDIERELDDCYGAQLSSCNSVRSEHKIVSLSMETLDDHYTVDSDGLFERSCKMLGEVIFSPLLKDGVFCSQVLRDETTPRDITHLIGVKCLCSRMNLLACFRMEATNVSVV